MSAKVWYYSNDGDKSGPFTLEAIIEFIETRLIVSETLVWKDGFQDWVSADACDDFSSYFHHAHSPPPLPRNPETYTSTELASQSKIKNQKSGIAAKIFFASIVSGFIYALVSDDSGTGAEAFGFALGAALALFVATYLLVWIPGGLYWIIKRKKMPGFDNCLWVVLGIILLLSLQGA
jgi:hypothetical protein